MISYLKRILVTNLISSVELSSGDVRVEINKILRGGRLTFSFAWELLSSLDLTKRTTGNITLTYDQMIRAFGVGDIPSLSVDIPGLCKRFGDELKFFGQKHGDPELIIELTKEIKAAVRKFLQL